MNKYEKHSKTTNLHNRFGQIVDRVPKNKKYDKIYEGKFSLRHGYDGPDTQDPETKTKEVCNMNKIKTRHDGDCTIYSCLHNNRPIDGICCCGFGWECVRKGDWTQMYSVERVVVQSMGNKKLDDLKIQKLNEE